jgi:SAM-dependent methyltransferase
MLLEAIYDYSDFLRKHLADYNSIRGNLEKNYDVLLKDCIRKNKKTKKSFEFEWSFLNLEKRDKIWGNDVSELINVLENETGDKIQYLNNKIILDAGCGHGAVTSTLGEKSGFAIGVELSRAVDLAYKNNKSINAHFVQADLQFLPFADSTFDFIYCSGVIHHTRDTELSFLLIESAVKLGGKICLWLYHPQKDNLHNLFLLIRTITKRLPLKICFLFLCFFIFPFSFLIKKIKRKSLHNYREEIIHLLDQFTPEYRFEIKHEIAASWLMRKMYRNIKITTQDQFGFSLVGVKENR